jgi:hypothetical protein
MVAYARTSILLLALVAAGVTAKTQESQPPQSPPRSNLAAMQEDARKMHAILDQMKENLAFVGSTTTPVNHQFALEIEMWQLQLDQLDRHIAEMQEKK